MQWFLTSAAVLAALTLGGCRPGADANGKDKESAGAAAVAVAAAAPAAPNAEDPGPGPGRTGRPGVRPEPEPGPDPDPEPEQPRGPDDKSKKPDPDLPGGPAGTEEKDPPGDPPSGPKGNDPGAKPIKPDDTPSPGQPGGDPPGGPGDGGDAPPPPVMPMPPGGGGGGGGFDGGGVRIGGGGGAGRFGGSPGPADPGGQPGGDPSGGGGGFPDDPGGPSGGDAGDGPTGGKVMPYLLGKTVEQATVTVTGVGLKVTKIIGKGVVTKQEPASGDSVTLGIGVKLTLGANPPTGPIKVPDVINQTAAAAKQAIESAKLKFQTDKPFSGPLTGYVAKQDPPAGTMVVADTKVTVTLSAKPTGSISVPDLINQPAVQAKAALEAVKLRFLTDKPASGSLKGYVVKQEPAAGASAAPGSAVTVTLGDKPVETVKVPDVTNQPAAQAKATLEAARLKFQTDKPDPGPPKNFVVKQVPVAGASAVPGTAVTVTLGAKSGDSAKVPFVLNLSGTAARQAIEAAGLKYQAAGPVPWTMKGFVTRQEPAAGTAVATGTTVTVELGARPSEPVKVPDLVGTPHDLARAKAEVEAAKLVFKPADRFAIKGLASKQDPPAGKSVAAGTVVTVTFGGKPVGPVKVPDLAGAAYARAKGQVEQAGLAFKAADPAQVAGTVSQQDPPAGKPVSPGAVVTVTFGGKPGDGPKVKVPDLTGMTVAQAKQALNQAKLTLQPTGSAPAGATALKQDPAAGQSVSAGTLVQVTFGSGNPSGTAGGQPGGPGGGAGQPAVAVKVPDVTGRTATLAKQALESAHLKYRAAGAASGPAKSQSPAAGTSVPPDTTVTVTFAPAKPAMQQQQQVKVPDVRGRDFASAQKALGDAGLSAQPSGDTRPPHRVDSQSPGPGAMVERGATVRLSMSK
jgi:beta-lactam-binding protein with PASTA domain